MQEGSVKNYQDRQPLFPGKSCFPLSADRPTSYADQVDQLNVIFDVIGTPAEADVSSIGNVKAYLKKLQPKTARDLKTYYAGATPDALDLLGKMLQFNPSARVTVGEALSHPFLKAVRRERDEAAPEGGGLDEMEEGEGESTIPRLREKIFREANFYREREQGK